MQGWNAGSINILTNAAYTIGVAGRPTRVYSAFTYGALGTGGSLRLMNNAAAGTEFARLVVDARLSSKGTDYVDFGEYGLLFPNTCYAVANSATVYSTIAYEVLPI
jgi:hypothetical protein